MIGSSDAHTVAHLFDPSRLTVVREWRGLTKKELASRIEKTPSAISQFESEDYALRPDADTVKRLSLALGVPIPFFALDSELRPIPLDAGHFRSLRSASQRDRRRLLAVASLLCDLVRFLEQHVDWPVDAVADAVERAGSIEDVEACARAARAAWGLKLGPIPGMTRLLESKGVLVVPIDQQSRKVDAFSLWHKGRPCVFLGTQKGSTSRAEFDAAHELGHLIRHADVAAGDRSAEREADSFASAFLLPKESFLPVCPRRLNWDHFVELKRRWRVSLAALVRRARDLGRLSDASYRRANIQLRGRLRELELNTEPPPLEPTTLPLALGEIRDDWPLSRIAEELKIGLPNLKALLAPYRMSLAEPGCPRPSREAQSHE